MPSDETISTKEQWYDLNKYKSEIESFVIKKRADLDNLSVMQQVSDALYKICYSGTTESDRERFPLASELFKVYKTALIESSLSGYSALVETEGEDAANILKAPKVKEALTSQFKAISLLERLSGETLDDWCFKGEAAGIIKLVETNEEYRLKTSIVNEETGKKEMSFTMKEGVKYQNLGIDIIDPLDFYVDALDYEKDPIGCAKIIRSYIDAKKLLSSNNYPLLSEDEKKAIITSAGRNGSNSNGWLGWASGFVNPNTSHEATNKNQIEVLTFNGDYITSDMKVLSNIQAVLVGNKIANLRYNTVSTNRIIYAAYKVDRLTHRGISPLANTLPINKLVNRVTDMFIKNLDEISNPWLLYAKGTMTSSQISEARKKRELEFNPSDEKPSFWSPPPAANNGLELVNLILQQNKNVLGLNSYMAGDTSGAVRTAEESAILFQKANARMRVETDTFSYRFMLKLFQSFYAFNRELALAYNNPLKEIYADPELKVSISTNASKADKEGELQRLMQMLNLPIAQMIFSNLQPDQTVLAVKYLMAKAGLTDVDNLLQLQKEDGSPQDITITPDPTAKDIIDASQGDNPQIMG